MLVHELINNGQRDAVAIVDHERQFTYAQLQEAVAAYRNHLYAADVREGDRVGIFSRNSADFIIAFMAITSLGAIAVPMNFQLSNREIAYIVKDAGIMTVLTYQPLNLVDALAELRCDHRVIQYDIKKLDRTVMVAPPAPKLAADFSANNAAMIIYTSGTTGNPKGAVLSHANLTYNVQQIHDSGVACDADCNVLCVLPMYHCYGWTCAVLYPLFVGAKIVILDSFTPKETIHTIREQKITDLYLVPSICSLLTKLGKVEDMQSLRYVVSAATTMPQAVADAFREKFGITICEAYGLSETSPILTMTPPDKPKTGSCGLFVPGVEWKIVDAHGESVPRGEVGELIVKGGNIMQGYWNLPDTTKDAMTHGWFHTGDIGRVDEEGYLFIVDRIKDMIISMGENIYPREVEELIYQFPGIHEAAVIGIPDKIRGQAGACFYTVNEGSHVSIRELKKFLQANLALYKIPREFHVMEKLPRTSTGKIKKRAIWAAYLETQKK